MGSLLVIEYLEKFILVLLIHLFFYHRCNKRSEPSQPSEFIPRDWEQGRRLINREEETAYEE